MLFWQMGTLLSLRGCNSLPKFGMLTGIGKCLLCRILFLSKANHWYAARNFNIFIFPTSCIRWEGGLVFINGGMPIREWQTHHAPQKEKFNLLRGEGTYSPLIFASETHFSIGKCTFSSWNISCMDSVTTVQVSGAVMCLSVCFVQFQSQWIGCTPKYSNLLVYFFCFLG